MQRTRKSNWLRVFGAVPRSVLVAVLVCIWTGTGVSQTPPPSPTVLPPVTPALPPKPEPPPAPKVTSTSAKPEASIVFPQVQQPTEQIASPVEPPRGVQDAPPMPEYYRPYSDPVPDYIFDTSYYEAPGVGARAIADYAPPGYLARDYQSAPGDPEFMPMDAPVRISAEERQKFVTRGLFPGSFMVPGMNTSFRLRGFVRLTGMYDFNSIGTPDIFVTNSIPVPQGIGQNANVTARPSRFAIESWTPTNFKDWNVHTFIEGDFFNGQGQAAGGGGNPFRLRHAFVDYGYFRVGQQNTVFMDGNTWPSLVDFQGPAGWVNQRRPGARVTLPITDKLFWAGGVEQPFSDVATNGLGTAVQDVPDFATHVRYESDLGHVQVSGLGRAIGYRPTFGEIERRGGYGMSTSTTFHPWAWLIGSNPIRKDNPSGLERCRIIGQYTFGWGIGRYMLDTVGLGLDGQVDPITGSFDVVYSSAWLASYEHWFTEKWMAQTTWSETLAAANGDQPAGTYVGARYVAGTLWYMPIRNLSLGAEYLYGERENIDSDRGRARRISMLAQYNF